MGFLGQAFDIDGLLGIVAQYAGAFALCAYESTTSGALRAFVHASSNPEQAPWYVAVCQRGLKVDIQETCSGAEVHHRLKHFYGALRVVCSPANWQWPVHGLEGAKRLELFVSSFCQACDPKMQQKNLLEFAFDPEKVRAVAASDPTIGPVLPPAHSGQYHGDFHPVLGIRSLELNVSGEAVFARQRNLEKALFLELRVGRPVNEGAWVQCMLWCGERTSHDDHRGLAETGQPDVDLRLRLPSGCASISLARVFHGSLLYRALTTHGTVRVLLAFATCTSM